jgi:hypothetical protein
MHQQTAGVFCLRDVILHLKKRVMADDNADRKKFYTNIREIIREEIALALQRVFPLRLLFFKKYKILSFGWVYFFKLSQK